MQQRKKEWLKAILILPFNVVIVFPMIILLVLDFNFTKPVPLFLFLAIVFLAIGLFLAIWTMKLFDDLGKGTAAPWSPPKHLVTTGPYKYVRNPMITSVIFMLIGESFLLSSFAIFIYAIVFFLINSIYFPLVEEKDLLKRFGKEYEEYKKAVPRWIPNFFLK